MSLPPPQGMNEVDYEAIEAAVTETVRGRWFLNEFARRNRLMETRLLLDAMERLETTVAASQTSLPSADPSIRLLVQRIKEIAGTLDGLARDMRDDGLEDRYWTAVDGQARAVGGLMRGAVPSKPEALPGKAAVLPPSEPESPSAPKPAPRLPPADLPAMLARRVAPPPDSPRSMPQAPNDPRLAALSGLDGLTLAQKLTLFT